MKKQAVLRTGSFMKFTLHFKPFPRPILGLKIYYCLPLSRLQSNVFNAKKSSVKPPQHRRGPVVFGLKYSWGKAEEYLSQTPQVQAKARWFYYFILRPGGVWASRGYLSLCIFQIVRSAGNLALNSEARL